MDGDGIGARARRLEDHRLLTGGAAFVDDLRVPGLVHAAILRSPHAHAVIRRLDTGPAVDAPGVLAVLTAVELEADGIGALPCLVRPESADGKPPVIPPHPLLARDRVRFVGDRVALVVAETPDQAREALERIEVDYRPLDAVVTPGDAVRPGAPAVWGEAPDNVCFRWQAGDGEAVARAFAAAARVVRLDLVNNRVIAACIEPRGVIGSFDAATGRYTLHGGTMAPFRQRRTLAGPVLGVGEERLRVVVPETGGNFGIKNDAYGEHGLVLWAARRLGRPVKWVAERSEGFASDSGARDLETRAELALDEDGRFLALRLATLANIGAYINPNSLGVPVNCRMIGGPYAIGAIHVEVKGVFTHTVHTGAYRGAGKPEALYATERLVDAAARELGVDGAELRRRNYVPAGAPCTTALGLVYGATDLTRLSATALSLADRGGFEARRKAALARGRLRGFGMASLIERCASAVEERARLALTPDGRATLAVGTMANGQGHATAFAQVVADRLGLPLAAVQVMEGDTDVLGSGSDSGGSRSTQVAGSATVGACARIIARGRRIAAHLLEASFLDVEFAAGRFAIAGTDRSFTLGEVVAAAFDSRRPTPGLEPGMTETATFAETGPTWPSSVHLCEVEVDPETGAVAIVRYVMAGDFGVLVNPMLVEGQLHGGLAQGLGQAVTEHAVYDRDDGQLLSGSFLDYALPRAGDVPGFELHLEGGAPSSTNPLGVKGVGETGCAGAPPAAMNAIIDALAPLGVRHLDMPATPRRVWEAMARARAARAVQP